MRLLRSSDVQASPDDRVFHHPRALATIVWLALFCGAAAVLVGAIAGTWKPGYVVGPVVLLFLLLTLRFVTARFHASNWLIRSGNSGLYAQYRSYLNDQLPADERSVIYISYDEIASARLASERIRTPDLARPRTAQTGSDRNRKRS